MSPAMSKAMRLATIALEDAGLGPTLRSIDAARHLRKAADRLYVVASSAIDDDIELRDSARFTARLCIREAQRIEKEEAGK